MHIFSTLLLAFGAVIVLVVALAAVLRDLLARGPHEAPQIEDDGMAWPRRTRATAGSSGEHERYVAASAWHGERENSGT